MLAREGVPGRLICTGPGATGIARLLELLGSEPSGPIILAGVAGSLCDEFKAGTAHLVTDVIGSKQDHRLRAHWPSSPMAETSVVIASSENVLISSEHKREFASATGAHLVDQEAAAFAALATERNWRWGIARGVSDEIETILPPDIHTWINRRGGTRISRVLTSCMMNPAQLSAVIELQRTSKQALRALAKLLTEHLAEVD